MNEWQKKVVIVTVAGSILLTLGDPNERMEEHLHESTALPAVVYTPQMVFSGSGCFSAGSNL
jgi:hypothetical protein